MTLDARWQAGAVDDLAVLLQPDPSVLALVVFGSAASAPDVWSDLDVLLIITPVRQEHYTMSLDWLRPLGEVYTVEQSVHPFAQVSRVCLTDMRRLDIVTTTEDALERYAEWPSLPFWNPEIRRVVFCRSARVERILSRPLPAPSLTLPSDEDFRRLADGFWFKGTLAVTKIMRDDRLIALHLVLEMMQDCCVLGMILRDRATGTTLHKTGGQGNPVADTLGALGPDATPDGLLRTLAQCATEFDRLTAQWLPAYTARRHPLLSWVEFAQQNLT